MCNNFDYILGNLASCSYCGLYAENVVDDELDEDICQDCLNKRNESDYRYCER